MSAKAVVGLIIFVSGLVLVFNETILAPGPSAMMIVLGAFLMGLPAFMCNPEERDKARGYKEIKPEKPKPLKRDTDLRIVYKIPPQGIEKEIARDMNRLRRYDERAKV